MLLSVLVVCALLAILWGVQSSSVILKIERSPIDFTPKTFGRAFEPFQACSEDGIRLEGWFVPCRKPSQSAVVVLHGWGACRSDVLDASLHLAEDHHLVYFDFRNHGLSGGEKTSLTCLEIRDFEAVVKYLRKKKPEETRRLGVLGFSMGGAVAISGSAQLPEIRAVAAESPFASYDATVDRFARVFYAVPRPLVPLTIWFSKLRLGLDPERCAPIRHIARLAPRPVLIIQGEADQRMPVREGQALYDAAREPKELWIIPGGDHLEARTLFPEEYARRTGEFFRKWLSATR